MEGERIDSMCNGLFCLHCMTSPHHCMASPHHPTPPHATPPTSMQVSIRVDDGAGNPGLTLSDWFVESGLDAPSAPKMVRTAVPPARSTTRGVSHPPTCTCVICKQARRATVPANGAVPAGACTDAMRGHYGFVVFPRQLDPGQERHRLPQYNYVPANDSRKRDQTLFVPVVPDPLVRSMACGRGETLLVAFSRLLLLFVVCCCSSVKCMWTVSMLLDSGRPVHLQQKNSAQWINPK